MRITTEETYETACREIRRLCHKDLHGGLAPEEKQQMNKLADALTQYEEDPSIFYFKRRGIPARAD